MTSVSTEKMTEVSEEQDVSGMFEGSEEAFENDESEESLYGESSKRKRKGFATSSKLPSPISSFPFEVATARRKWESQSLAT